MTDMEQKTSKKDFKNSRPIAAFLLFLSLVILLLFSSQFEANAKQLNEITILIPRSNITIHPDARGFAKFSTKGLQQLGQTGQPALAYLSFTVLLPPNIDFSSVTASITGPQWEEVTGKWDIPPVPPIATWHEGTHIVIWPEGKNIVGGKDVDIYNTDAIFPAETIARVDTVVMRKWNMVHVFCAAYRYNPVTKSLYRLSDVALQITFDRDLLKSTETTSDLIGIEQVRDRAVNFDEAIEEYGGYEASSPGRYVIITTDTIGTTSTKLADSIASKEARGYAAKGDKGILVSSGSYWL